MRWCNTDLSGASVGRVLMNHVDMGRSKVVCSSSGSPKNATHCHTIGQYSYSKLTI